MPCCERRGWEFPIMAGLAVIALVVAIIVLIVAKEEIVIIAILAGVAGLLVIAMVISAFIRCYRERPAKRTEIHEYKTFNYRQESQDSLKEKVPPALVRTHSTIRHDRRDVQNTRRHRQVIVRQPPTYRDTDTKSTYIAFVRNSADTTGTLARRNSAPDIRALQQGFTIAPALPASQPAAPIPTYHITDTHTHFSNINAQQQPVAHTNYNFVPFQYQDQRVSVQPTATQDQRFSFQPTVSQDQRVSFQPTVSQDQRVSYQPTTTQDDLSIVLRNNMSGDYSTRSSTFDRTGFYSTMPNEVRLSNVQDTSSLRYSDPRYNLQDGQYVTKVKIDREPIY